MLRKDDLQYNGLSLVQDTDEYCFTSDAVVLSSLARAKKTDTVVDFGAGNGAVSILVAAKTNCKKVIGIELQENAATLARQNVEDNNLSHQIEIVNADIKDSIGLVGHGSVQVVVCNPPYFAQSSGQTRQSAEVALGRHETSATLADIIKSAADILSYGGKLFMVHKVTRLAEVFLHMSNNRLEPKKLTLIYPKASKSPDTFVVEGKKGASPSLTIDTLIVYEENGEYTAAAKLIYNIK